MNFKEQLGFEPIWLQIKMDELKLKMDITNSTVQLKMEEECDNIYLKLFFWTDYERVSDIDVSIVKTYIKNQLKLDNVNHDNMGIRVRDCKALGYPVVFNLEYDGKKTDLFYITYDDNIKHYNSLETPLLKNIETSNLYCLRYHEQLDNFKYWKYQNREIKLDNLSVSSTYDLPARFIGNNDNKLLLTHFICSNGIPDKLVEFWNNDLYIVWDVIKKDNVSGIPQKKELVISDLIKGVYKSMYFSDTYINKCLIKYAEITDLDLTMNLETFITTKKGEDCKEKIPNKLISHVYNLDFTNFLK